MIRFKNWQIQNDRDQDSVLRYLRSISGTFESFLGFSNEELEECRVFISDKNENPRLIENYNPIRLRLSNAVRENNWELIFELSHELGHFYLRQRNLERREIIHWLEETFCEAMSIYTLYQFLKDWQPENERPQFQQYIDWQYYTEEVRGLNNVTNLDELIRFDQASEEKREERTYERKLLCDAIRKKPQDIICFSRYLDFKTDENIPLLNIDALKKEYPNNSIVEIIEKIQPNINCELCQNKPKS